MVSIEDKLPDSQSSKLEKNLDKVMNENDVGLYIDKHVPDFMKEELLKNPWMPPHNYKFYEHKQGNKTRTFQMSWMNRFSWFVYSNVLEGALCKVCVLFKGMSGVGKGSHQKLSCLVKRPFKNWKDAIEVFENHARTSYHREAIISAGNFQKVCSGEKDDIYTKLNKDSSNLIKKNREMLARIIQTIIFCGRQEIALRGTDDNSRVSLEEPNFNDGNFRSLLRFRLKCGDKLLEHINSSGNNALYTSSTVQNELINLIGEDIQKQIVQKISNSKFFTILADGTTDVRRTEQFSMCIRYVDTQKVEIGEDFLKFVPVFDSTGKALADVIKSHIRDIGLDLSLLRGQGYDGASSMKGQFKGVQAYIQAEYPKALYTHCVAHCLNLSLADSSKVQSIRNVLGTISETCSFFRSSAKRSHILKEHLKLSERPTVSSLRKYCETRWVERHEAVALFADTVPQIIEALENIIEKQGCADDTAKASSLHKNICSFHFIIGLVVTEKILGLTHALSEYLQSKCVDLNIAVERIDLVTEKIATLRKNAIKEFNVLFKKAEIVAADFGILADLPRRVGSQKHRENYPTDSPEDYYRQSIFIPYLDEILSSLKERFMAHGNEILALHNVIPRYCIQKSFADIKPALDFYIDDIQDKSLSVLEGEWDLWVLKWKNAMRDLPESVPKYAVDALKESSNDIFPNMSILLHILAVLPVSTASVERSFSTLKRLKSYLRNSTGDERLTSLALMSIHRDIKVNEKFVIDKYAANHNKIQ